MQEVWQKTDSFIKKRHIPFNMVIELTRRCNLNCIHCYNIKNSAELSFVQIKHIARQLRQAGCLFLTLTGGEVFTRSDFLDVVTLLRQEGFDIKIFTNATLINSSIAKELGKLTPSEIGVSLLGARAETHDAITGVSGSFAKSLASIKLLKKQGLAVHLKCTLMKENVNEYDDFVRLAGQLGLTYLIDPIVSVRDDGSRQPLEHRLDEGQIRSLYQRFAQDTEEFAQLKEGFPCEAGRDFGAISASGDVYACIQIPISLGNVFEDSFKHIWTNAPLLNKLRRAGRDNFGSCRDCTLASECIRCPGFAYLEDGDLFGKSSLACFLAKIHKEVKES